MHIKFLGENQGDPVAKMHDQACKVYAMSLTFWGENRAILGGKSVNTHVHVHACPGMFKHVHACLSTWLPVCAGHVHGVQLLPSTFSRQ